jgi:uncharacterized membrane protein YraQ (UPF0718 family)
MTVLYVIVSAAFLVSLLADRHKTKAALMSAAKKLMKILPLFLVLTVGVALMLYMIPETVIAKVLGEEHLLVGVAASSLIGSIALIPGFIVFPLCGILRAQGITYTVLSAFTTTLMMVGILTIGVEREYLGWRLTLARNLSGFIMAMTVALITGLIFGEIPA